MKLDHKIGRSLKKASPTILTCIGAAGVVATAVLAVKATPKADSLIKADSRRNHDGDPYAATKLEAVKSCWKCYIPAAATGVATIICIFGANTLNKKQQASLASAYALVNRSYTERFSMEDGTRVRSYYSGFRTEKFEEQTIIDKPEPTTRLIQFDGTVSAFDKDCADCPAQYATSKETPSQKWEKVTKTLSQLDTSKLHYDVDIEAARNELQGTGTASRFGENYIYAEAIITAALYSREKFKGTGTPDFFCTPHLVNVMLLARDTNGRRIYNSKADLAAALNINELHTAEQFEGLARTDKTGKKHNLLGIFVNLSDYTVGSTKGGEITRFNQFDIDFNQEKYLIETRLSGALTRLWSAIALEEPVKASSGQTEDAGHDGT